MTEVSDDHFEIEIDGDRSGNTLEATRFHDVIAISVDNPWAGDTETGFGYTCRISLTPKQAAEFGLWLLGDQAPRPGT